MERQANTDYILSLSYGKDSLACLEAIMQLGYPLDRIVHAEIMATDTIPADLPIMVEFKQKADRIIRERYGIAVEHVTATEGGTPVSYESLFYREFKRGKHAGKIYGFPMTTGAWCNSKLKVKALDAVRKQANNKSVCYYLGIAADEPKRIERQSSRKDIVLPLVDIGWNEDYCRKWCEENNLLSPIYSDSARGGCWFCHNQSIDQLRLLWKNHPDLWDMLLKWDLDSPVSFRSDGRTVHHLDTRFIAEDLGLVPQDKTFRWKSVDALLIERKEKQTWKK